jgi:hydrogenase expression/formation protein HypE
MVAREDASRVLEAMRSHKYGKEAAIIGEVVSEPAGRVLMETLIGSHRVVDVLMGEMLPRIC